MFDLYNKSCNNCIFFPVGNLNVEIMKYEEVGRVGSDFLSAIAGRVGSTFCRVGSGRVGSKKSDPWTTLMKTETLMNALSV